MTETKFYYLKEIAQNDGKNGNKVWFIFKDSVYDPTEYLDDHPGGGDLITEWAGKDATKGFNDAGHSNDALKELKQYKIGEVHEDDRKNGKKTPAQKGDPKVVVSPSENHTSRSCISTIFCGLCG